MSARAPWPGRQWAGGEGYDPPYSARPPRGASGVRSDLASCLVIFFRVARKKITKQQPTIRESSEN